MTARILILLAVLAMAVSATARETLEQFDARVLAELRAQDAQAADLFAAAGAARDREAWDEASRLYAQVTERVPSFDHALRRRSACELALGHRDTAIGLAQDAVNLSRSAENLSALVGALIEGRSIDEAPEGTFGRARMLAREAAALDPGSPVVVGALVKTALAFDDLAGADEAVTAGVKAEPEDPQLHYLRAIVLGGEGRLDESRGELEQARTLGLSEEQYAAVDQALDESRPLWRRILGPVLVACGAWGACFVLLLLAGMVLSARTLRFAEAVAAGGNAGVVPSGLRRAYSAVLWLTCAFYYVSLPMVLLSVLAAGGAIVALMLSAGFLALKLLVIVAIVTVGSLVAVVVALFARGSDSDPGERLDLAAVPRLRALLDDVARKLETPPIEAVYLTPGAELAVFERGGVARQMRNAGTRSLILGAAVLDGMSLPAFRAVLAHEYGHLAHRDTAGGGRALAVRRSITEMARRLAGSGAASTFNPAWWFVIAYHSLFVRISHGATRLQEVMADRRAVATCGSEPFIEGFRHVFRREVDFQARAMSAARFMLESRAPVVNVYQWQGAGVLAPAEVDEGLVKLMTAPATAHDTHPPPQDRIRWAQAMAVPAPPADDAGKDGWSLFDDRAAVEERMSRALLARLRY